ncbi:MAG TPA: biopolymer transporter ExbD [Hymenobacter sp.]|uniref:ExbD/TolR family protein n=1 Tax=Hymenobacter sp. TaxID=1898978 RepID=UPI002D80C310|nr:biopolymer transporter ExbD [Hymenobacter sp.]HET9504046.1 biopolymer transporter ExbD [Hymenobacter sp.]
MAAIQQPAPKAGKKPRTRKHSFHLDMTPMVDLAFLLLTFFMLTTTLAKPRVMQLTMPVPDKTEPFLVASHGAMTIVLGKNHQMHYYFGLNAPADPTVAVPPLHTTDFKAKGIRQVLLAFRRQEPKGVILIKSGSAAVYRDMVDILDEMSITDQQKYALTDLSAADRQLLAANGKE